MGKFVIKDAKNGVKFDLKAGNGEIILSSEVYSSLASCKGGIASVQKNAPIAALEDQTEEGFKKEKNPKFEVYVDKAGEFRFRLKARNGEIIGTGESYKKKAGCLNGIESIRKNAVDAKIEREEKK
ncbi:MAG: YegP family protein [Oscillospiraceae bacterium]|nr:YegP family protein [Oscillospiraceae bacterium]